MCIDAYIKAANSHKQVGSYFMAAKAMENAGSLAVQQLKNYKTGANYYKSASDFFIAHGSPDKAADCLEKAAKY
jgi:hypothetical protein